MIELISLLVSAAVEGNSSRARTNELKNRLGLRERVHTGLRGRIAWVMKQPNMKAIHLEALYDIAYNAYVAVEPAEAHFFTGDESTLELFPSYNTPLDPVVPWLYRELAAGRLSTTTRLGGRQDLFFGNTDSVQIFLGWIQDQGPSLFDLHYADAMALVEEWIGDTSRQFELEEKRRWRELRKSQAVIHRWSDGWYLVELRTPEDFIAETDALGHCIGEGGYDSRLEEGTNRAYLSLRSPQGSVRSTFECLDQRYLPGRASRWDEVGDFTDGRWKVRQVRGRRNLPPSGSMLWPSLRALHWIVSNPLEWPRHAFEQVDLTDIDRIDEEIPGMHYEDRMIFMWYAVSTQARPSKSISFADGDDGLHFESEIHRRPMIDPDTAVVISIRVMEPPEEELEAGKVEIVLHTMLEEDGEYYDSFVHSAPLTLSEGAEAMLSLMGMVYSSTKAGERSFTIDDDLSPAGFVAETLDLGEYVLKGLHPDRAHLVTVEVEAPEDAADD